MSNNKPSKKSPTAEATPTAEQQAVSPEDLTKRLDAKDVQAIAEHIVASLQKSDALSPEDFHRIGCEINELSAEPEWTPEFELKHVIRRLERNDVAVIFDLRVVSKLEEKCIARNHGSFTLKNVLLDNMAVNALTNFKDTLNSAVSQPLFAEFHSFLTGLLKVKEKTPPPSTAQFMLPDRMSAGGAFEEDGEDTDAIPDDFEN